MNKTRLLSILLSFSLLLFMGLKGSANDDCIVKGIVLNSSGEPLPFVNIYFENTNKGTSSNFNGKFSIRCNQDKSKKLVFQYIGYVKQSVTIDYDNPESIEVRLQPENVKLPEFEVDANAEDPAYAVIRQAQKRRKYHLNQFDNFSADIYMKSTARLNEIPEKMPMMVSLGSEPIDSSDLGLIYLSESVASFHFNKPKYREEMQASKISGYNHAFSWNRVRDLLFNFYENNLEFRGVSKRNFVSPIGNSAMFYYDYKLMGTFYENDKLINKIKVIPKRNHDPVFHGTIYIVEDDWAVHSLDLFVTKEAQIEFADTISLKQSYVELQADYYMPLSLEINYNYSIFGFKAEYYSIGMFSNYELEKSFEKGFFSNEIFKVEHGANEIENEFWNDSRPVVLTDEEEGNYHEQDSLYQLRNSPEYLDSVDRASNKFKPLQFIFSPYTYQNSLDSTNWRIQSLFRSIQYNTVEGRVANVTIEHFNRKGKGIRKLGATFRYGLGSNQPYAKAEYVKRFNSINYSTLRIEGGSFPEQINPNDPIHPFINSVYSGFMRQNFIKLHERNFLSVSYSRELVNGLFAYSTIDYARRVPLNNTDDFSYFYRDERDFTSNRFPEDASNNMLSINVDFVYRHQQKYATYPNTKRILGSDYPTLFAGIKHGQGIENDSRFTLVKLGIGHDISLGLFGDSKFDIHAGKFIDANNLSFFDMMHFNGNQTIVNNAIVNRSFFGNRRSRLNSFHTLPYYQYSTNNAYVHAHYVHHFNGFIINKIPLLRKTKFRTLAGVNFLYTEENTGIEDQHDFFRSGEYLEFYVGLENIFKILRIDFAAYYQQGEPIKPAFRIGLEF